MRETYLDFTSRGKLFLLYYRHAEAKQTLVIVAADPPPLIENGS